ncbi:hypothetical protein SNARM312S_05672 [Streptomyces narbonensis]
MTQSSVEPKTASEDAGSGSNVPAGRSWLDRYFHISERGSTVATEIRGGVTTFMAMAYILLLEPDPPRSARTSRRTSSAAIRRHHGDRPRPRRQVPRLPRHRLRRAARLRDAGPLSPMPTQIVVDWPHRYLESTEVDGRTVLCVLTHDAKFDVPLIKAALKLPVAYIGAMGSRRTHEDRNKRLRDVGVTELELARLRSPIGLDLGARTPEETALSIGAEIVANRRGGSGASLTGAHTPIHHDGPREPDGRIGSVA